MKVWAQKQTDNGFTIVELLIVVVVIAILAAITIVSYNGIQNRANESVIQANLRDNFNKIVAYRSEYDAYPTSAATLETLGLKVNGKVFDNVSANSFLFCYYNDNSDAVLLGRTSGGKMYSYGAKRGFVEMTEWGTSMQQRCNSAFGLGAISDYTGRSTVNGVTTGGQWTAWTGASN